MAQEFWWTNQREELYSKFIKDLEEKGGNIIGCQATTKSRISSGRMMNFRFAITSIKIRRYFTYFEKMKKKGRKEKRGSSLLLVTACRDHCENWLAVELTGAARLRFERERERKRMREVENKFLISER